MLCANVKRFGIPVVFALLIFSAAGCSSVFRKKGEFPPLCLPAKTSLEKAIETADENAGAVLPTEFYELQKLGCSVLTINGDYACRKRTRTDQAILVIEGEGIVILGDERNTFESGALFFIPAKTPYEIINPSQKPITLLIFESPPGQKDEKIVKRKAE